MCLRYASSIEEGLALKFLPLLSNDVIDSLSFEQVPLASYSVYDDFKTVVLLQDYLDTEAVQRHQRRVMSYSDHLLYKVVLCGAWLLARKRKEVKSLHGLMHHFLPKQQVQLPCLLAVDNTLTVD